MQVILLSLNFMQYIFVFCFHNIYCNNYCEQQNRKRNIILYWKLSDYLCMESMFCFKCICATVNHNLSFYLLYVRGKLQHTIVCLIARGSPTCSSFGLRQADKFNGDNSITACWHRGKGVSSVLKPVGSSKCM